MLLSDRDILAAQAEGHISLEPWTPEMVQPASIDVRLDRFFPVDQLCGGCLFRRRLLPALQQPRIHLC